MKKNYISNTFKTYLTTCADSLCNYSVQNMSHTRFRELSTNKHLTQYIWLLNTSQNTKLCSNPVTLTCMLTENNIPHTIGLFTLSGKYNPDINRMLTYMYSTEQYNTVQYRPKLLYNNILHNNVQNCTSYICFSASIAATFTPSLLNPRKALMNMANSNKLSEIVRWTETGHWFQEVVKSCKKLKPFQLCEFLHNFHSPVLEIQVGNIPVLAIIDSGCSSFLMSQGYHNTLFKNQQLDTYKGLPFQQASGAALPIKGTFLTDIQIGPLKTHTQIIVFESNDYHKEILLGWDYIKAQNILIASDGLYDRKALHQKTDNDTCIPIKYACGAGRDASPPHGTTQGSPLGSNSPEETSLNISDPFYDQIKLPVIIVKDYTILEGQCEIIQCKLKLSLENRKVFDNFFSNTKYFVFSSENLEPYEYILKLSIYFQMLSLDHFEQPFDLIYRNYSKQTVFLSNKDIVAYCTEMELAGQSDFETLSLKKPALFLAAKLLQPADSHQDIAPSLKSPNFSRLELGQKSISPIDLDQINSQDIIPEHLQILKTLIQQHAPLFASHAWSVGLCGSTFEMSVRDSCVPQQARLIPVPNKMKDQAIEILKKLIDLGLVTESKSPWKSNILFLMKKGYKLKKENGVLEKIPISKIRIVLDFRAVNKALRINWCAYPIPKIQDILATIQGKKYVTRLDISQGFWSVKLGPKASNLCSFEFLGGLYKLTRLGQGLIPSSFVFQRAVHRLILKNKLGENVSNYLDDIVVTSQTIEEHFDILKIFFFNTSRK